MPRVILHAGHALDQHRDAGQGPEARTEPMGVRALAQRHVDAGQLCRGQARLAPGSARGAQRLPTAVAPRVIPPHDALAAHSEAPRDSGQRLATRGKQPRRPLSTNFQPVEIPSWSNMCGHASMVRRWRRASVTILYETH